MKDRIQIIQTDILDISSKIEICKKFFAKSHFTDNNIKCFIENFTQEAGVRNLKQHIQTLSNEISLRKLKDGTRYVKFIKL